MNAERITLIAVGDIIIDRDEPTTIFKHVVDVLRAGDITFANCDQVYSDKGYPNIDIPMESNPRNIPALVYAGLDVISLANNHSLDWGPEALVDSVDRVRQAEIKVVGAGKNITEARRPAIIEKKGNRIGFLAYCCLGPRGSEATEERPGYAPMRAWTIYEQVDYQPGTDPRIITLAYKDDLAAMEEDIRKLKSQVDVVAISFHWGLHRVPAKIPMYEFEVGHVAIDAGADIILGGHAHILKGIEVYQGKVIFHSLNNFAAELRGAKREKVMKAVKEKGVGGDSESDPESAANRFREEAKATIIARLIIEGGKISKVSYIPCYINGNFEPEIVTRSNPRGEEVFRYVEKISRHQNLFTNFVWEGDEVVISV